MKVIIAGSRTCTPTIEQIDEVITKWHIPVTEVVCGMARGADLQGKEWADTHGISIAEFPAYWDTQGKHAGRIRNRRMAAYGDVLLAFWDGKSRGTQDMIKCMLGHEKPIHVVWNGHL